MNNKKLAYLYDIDNDVVTKYKQYLDIPLTENCCYYEPQPYVEIESKNYSAPIKYIVDYYKHNINHDYYSDLIKRADSLNNKMITINDILDDKIMLEYINNKPNIHVLLFWPSSRQPPRAQPRARHHRQTRPESWPVQLFLRATPRGERQGSPRESHFRIQTPAGKMKPGSTFH